MNQPPELRATSSDPATPPPTPTEVGSPDDADSQQIVVIIARTGGFAGMRKEWRAEPAPDAQPRWIALIDSCPWDADTVAPSGADRFTWHFRVRCGPQERTAELPEQAVEGPWQTLVDEVRDAATRATPSPSPGPSPAGR